MNEETRKLLEQYSKEFNVKIGELFSKLEESYNFSKLNIEAQETILDNIKKQIELNKESVEYKKSEAELSSKVNENLNTYFDTTQRIKNIKEKINSITKEIQKEEDRTRRTSLEITLKQYETEINQYEKSLNFTQSIKNELIGTIDVKRRMNDFLKDSWGLWKDIDKGIRTSNRNIGLTGELSNQFKNSIIDALPEVYNLGGNVEEISEFYSSMNEMLGKQIVLSRKGLVNFIEISKATNLTENQIANMVSNMHMFGRSIEDTHKMINELMVSSNKMGINSIKVIKVLEDNIERAQSYSFRDGIKGITKMAQTAVKFRMDMSDVFSFAEKLFEPEGAIEAAAQLQMLGGAFGQLADPFQLMYMARNAPEELAKSIAEATKATAQFNKTTGEFDISAQELHRLRKVAEATGMDFGNLVKTAKEAARLTRIKGDVSWRVKDEGLKDAISKMAVWDETKQIFTVTIDGRAEDIAKLTKEQAQKLASDASKTTRDMAKDLMTIEEQTSAMMSSISTLGYDLRDIMNTTIKPVFNELPDRLVKSSVTIRNNLKEVFSTELGDIGFKSIKDDILGGVNKLIEEFTTKGRIIGDDKISPGFISPTDKFISPATNKFVKPSAISNSVENNFTSPTGGFVGPKTTIIEKTIENNKVISKHVNETTKNLDIITNNLNTLSNKGIKVDVGFDSPINVDFGDNKLEEFSIEQMNALMGKIKDMIYREINNSSDFNAGKVTGPKSTIR